MNAYCILHSTTEDLRFNRQFVTITTSNILLSSARVALGVSCECVRSPSGCYPDIFRDSAAVGESVIHSCGAIHPAFNSPGRVRWTCEDHLTWVGDLTNCTMVPSYNKSILLFLYRVRAAPGSTIGLLLSQPDPLEQDVSQT